MGSLPSSCSRGNVVLNLTALVLKVAKQREAILNQLNLTACLRLRALAGEV
jgi:hypothetical protein